MSRAESNFPPDDKATIVCLHCGKMQDVARKAMTITCKYCSKSLRLEDLRFKEYQARRVIETCGIITVEKKGQVIADKIHCGGLIVRGKLRGAILSRGPVLVSPDAEIKGDVTAPTLAVGAGAVLEGNYEIGADAKWGIVNKNHAAAMEGIATETGIVFCCPHDSRGRKPADSIRAGT